MPPEHTHHALGGRFYRFFDESKVNRDAEGKFAGKARAAGRLALAAAQKAQQGASSPEAPAISSAMHAALQAVAALPLDESAPYTSWHGLPGTSALSRAMDTGLETLTQPVFGKAALPEKSWVERLTDGLTDWTYIYRMSSPKYQQRRETVINTMRTPLAQFGIQVAAWDELDVPYSFLLWLAGLAFPELGDNRKSVWEEWNRDGTKKHKE